MGYKSSEKISSSFPMLSALKMGIHKYWFEENQKLMENIALGRCD